MNYCSIEDAWGTSNYVSNQFKEYMTNINSENKSNNLDTNIEYFTELKPDKSNKEIKKKVQVYNLNNTIDELNNCDSFILHVSNCRKCYNKMRNQFKPQLIKNFQDIIDENRDTIVLILIGISILLFFNLINNVTKN
jgi:uncharacterized protein YpuA (DUF1002 family)